MFSLASFQSTVPFGGQLALTVILGFLCGSFGTMLVYRLPRQKSISGRSHCTACGKTIAWYDLIPVVSYLLLLGRCRFCRERIPIHYPLLECVTAVLFVSLFLHFFHEPLIPFLPIAVAAFCTLLIAFHDSTTQSIPDVLIVILFLAALTAQVFPGEPLRPDSLRMAFIGAGIPFLFFGTLWSVSRGAWIGSGDVLLGIALGLLLGAKGSILMLFLAYVLGAGVVSALLILKKIDRKGTIAFGPFLAIGALVALFFGDQIIAAYMVVLVGQ